MKFKNLVCSIVTISAVFFLTNTYADDLSKEIFISDAWVQAMPPTQTTTAAYMVITNNSSKEAVLSSASCAMAGLAELHQMGERNGMMSMSMVGSIPVPAQGKVSLQPGGFHIMLLNLRQPVSKGDTVPITLHFQDGTNIVVKAEVKIQQADDNSSMPGMKM